MLIVGRLHGERRPSVWHSERLERDGVGGMSVVEPPEGHTDS